MLAAGIEMLGGDDLALPHPWLTLTSVTVRMQWRYPHAANIGVIRLFASTALDLSHEPVTSFALD